MCAGAIINSRIKNVYFGASDYKNGACGSVVNLFDLSFNHKPSLERGILEEQCSEILTVFFKNLREKKAGN
jgi:tRNA(adenine34) deaminase